MIGNIISGLIGGGVLIVETLARLRSRSCIIELHLCAVLAGNDPKPIVFDLVQPLAA